MLFPNLHSLDLPAPGYIAHEHWSRMQAVAKEVRARTQARCWFDTMRDELCIGYQDANGYIRLIDGFPAFHVEGRSSPNRFDPALDGQGVDDLVHLVHLARVDANLKSKWRVQAQRAADDDKKKRIARFEDEIKPDIARNLKFNRGQRVLTSMGV